MHRVPTLCDDNIPPSTYTEYSRRDIELYIFEALRAIESFIYRCVQIGAPDTRAEYSCRFAPRSSNAMVSWFRKRIKTLPETFH